MNLKNALFGFLAAVLCFSLAGCKWEDDNKTPPGPAPSGYEVTVYKDGNGSKVEVESYSVEGDELNFKLKSKDNTGHDQGNAKGAWVVKHNAWKAAPAEKRYQATLYNGNKVVGTWSVRSFSTDSQSVLLFPSDGSEVLRVSGDLVISSAKSGSASTAKHRVTVYNGDTAVYKLDLSSHSRAGHHLEGEAANGSGSVFIWGNYKVENLD